MRRSASFDLDLLKILVSRMEVRTAGSNWLPMVKRPEVLFLGRLCRKF